MELCLIDLDRNTRVVPTKQPSKDLIGAMRLLAVSAADHTGRIEFQVDEEFLAALIAQDTAEASDPSAPAPRQVTETDNPKRVLLDNIPVVVPGWDAP